jgi:hypothetical protein
MIRSMAMNLMIMKEIALTAKKAIMFLFMNWSRPRRRKHEKEIQ